MGEYAEDANYYGKDDQCAVAPFFPELSFLGGCQGLLLFFVMIVMVMMVIICLCHFIFVLYECYC